VTVPATAGKPASETEGKKSAAKTNDKSSPEKPAPQEKPVQVSTLAANGPSRIAQSTTPQTADVAPAFSVDSGSSPNLSTLARPAASTAPTASIEQSQLEPLQLIRTVPPVYPAIAKARHMSGIVVVEATVGKDGRAKNPKFISGAPVFKDAAFDAVLKYQFKPAKLNGQAIEQTTQVRLNFNP
jgi:protein TonB